MPNQRRAGQMFLGFQADQELVRDLDRGRGRKDRSRFIREAIAEKLNREGIRVREDLIYPPERAARVEVNYANGGAKKGRKNEN
jgi:metal-responsive CopG/Arc/MetJ family transcriptional regulator